MNFIKHTTKLIVALLFTTAISGNTIVNAQQLQMNSFVLFGGDGLRNGCTPPTSPGAGVIIAGGSSSSCGSVGSYALVKSTGPVSITGDVHSRSLITLSTNNTVTGKITAANISGSTATVLSVGNVAQLGGNIDVNGKIVIGNTGIVSGKVTRSSGTYTGPVPALGSFVGATTIPTLPVLPAITSFPAAGLGNVTNTQTINPGAGLYNKIALTGNKTVTFAGPGVYVFNTIKNSGSPFNKFVFDFQNSPAGTILIYVHGDVNMNKLNVDIINGGGASRIYLETHGSGSTSSNGTYAFEQANGVNGNRKSEWFGTVWAPYAAINFGSSSSYSTMTGALWSGTQVNVRNNVTINCAPFGGCLSTADAGADKQLTCSINSVQLNGTSSTTGAQFSWSFLPGGHISGSALIPNPMVDVAGTYILTVTNPTGGCTAKDTAVVTFIPCIIPYFHPPDSGKTNDIIGSELNSLYDDPTNGDTTRNIFIISNDSVWIEVIARAIQYPTLLALLQTPPYGMTDLIDNGPNTLIISGKYPIANLLKLDSLPVQVDYARPLFPAISNTALIDSGATYTKGDIAFGGDAAREGFNINGSGIKVGVISNSYNTILGNPALTNVVNFDLPGVGNPTYTRPVRVIKDYPFGSTTDEGRAMLQLVHDVAPGAALSFHTGFTSAGNFAQGIKLLQQDTCNIIVDDVTYITEPFFQDGVVAKAVDLVTSQGVSYFSSAGNFGNKSYEGVFNPASPPSGLTGSAHNFGGGDILQNVSLTPGNYTIVLQWADSIYSLGQTATGTNNDLDIYLTNNSGTTLFGFNRNNIGGDPLEVLPFSVTENTDANIMIIRATGSVNVNFKYIVFRGELTINEHQQGTSTVVGQANATSAMAVGAVHYTNNPPFNVNPPFISTFSSIGGTPVYGSPRSKPDFSAPNGVNTTVEFGAPNVDGDLFPNFFGTSAAAPHAAGGAALIMQAKKKFLNQASMTFTEMRALLQTTATDMGTTGFDSASGSGMIQINTAIKTFATPKPIATNLIVPGGVTPGTVSFVVTVQGKYFTPQSKVVFRGVQLTTTPISSTLVSATIPVFPPGNPPIQVYNPPVTLNGDGGYSDSIYFFNPIKKNIIVIANDTVKKFGEKIPVFRSTVLVDGLSLAASGLTLAQLGLSPGSLLFSTSATNLINTGIYFIHPSREFDPANPVDVGLLESYNYSFVDGFLTVGKMPLTIIARDTTLTYGDKIDGLSFNYIYDDSKIDAVDKNAFLNSLKSDHQSQLAEELVLIDAQHLVNGRALADSDLVNLSFIASERSIENARNLLNAKNLLNTVTYDTTKIVDVAVECVFNYEIDSANGVLVNAKNLLNDRSLVNAKNLLNGTATVNARNLLNGSSIVNSTNVNDTSNTNTVVVIDEDDVNAPPNDSLNNMKSIIMITGITVGDWAIVPGAYLTNNFIIQYQKGNLHILPATLTVTAEDTSRFYNTPNPDFRITYSGFVYDDTKDSIVQPVAGTTADEFSSSGDYPITFSGGSSVNYNLVFEDGILTVIPNPCFIEISAALISSTTPIPVDVDDGNPCTIDACDPVNGITHTPVNIDDGIACTIDACDLQTGVITHTPEILGAISGPARQCLPATAGSATFSITPLSGVNTYIWSVPVGLTIANGQGTPTITVHWTASFAHYGITGPLCVNASSTCGNQQSCINFELNASKPVLPGSISGPAKVCPGDIAVYSVISVSRATSYIWTVPSGVNIISGQSTNAITVEVVNGFAGGAISVAGINVCGTGAARAKTISRNNPSVPIPITGPASGLCNSSGVMYSLGSIAVPLVASDNSTYQWSVSGGTINGSSTDATVMVDWGNFNSGYVAVVQINACTSSAPRTLNTAGTPAKPEPIVGPVNVCTYSTYHYAIPTVAGALSYLWTAPAGSSIIGQNTKEIDVTFAGTPAMNQTISVKSVNACGNSSARLLNAISIDGCAARNSAAEVTSEINIYPNPSHDNTQITFTSASDDYADLAILTIDGRIQKEVFKGTVMTGSANTLTLKTTGWGSGVYLVRLTIGNEITYKKLVITE